MSDTKRIDLIFLIISIASFLLMSISFLFMPFGKIEDGSTSIITYISGGMFWFFLVLGTVFQAILSKRRKDWYIYYRVKRNPRIARPKRGIISFFKNTYGIVADVIMVLSLIGFILSIIFTDGRSYICYILISTSIFAFCMHCIFNGKIFYHIENQDKLLRAIEKERNEQSKESV